MHAWILFDHLRTSDALAGILLSLTLERRKISQGWVNTSRLWIRVRLSENRITLFGLDIGAGASSSTRIFKSRICAVHTDLEPHVLIIKATPPTVPLAQQTSRNRVIYVCIILINITFYIHKYLHRLIKKQTYKSLLHYPSVPKVRYHPVPIPH